MTRRTVTAWLLATAIVAAAVRICAAVANPGACYDAYLYAGYAEHLAAGDLAAAFSYLNLNVYVAAAAAAIGCGIDPLTFGRVLSLTASVATVWPLFGFVAGLYGRRAGVAACAMYALQPPLAKLAVEPIRDPLFLLLFVSALWAIRRVAVRPTIPSSLCAGLLVAAAIHTRSEGWALMLPLAGFPLSELWNRRREPCLFRRTLARGGSVAAAAAVLPCLLLLVNVSLLRGHDRWELGRLAPVTMLFGDGHVCDSSPADAVPDAEPEPASAVVEVVPVPAAAPVRTASLVTPAPPPACPTVDLDERPHCPDFPRRPWLHVYTLDVANTFHPLLTALILIGTVRFAGRLRRPEYLVLAVTIAALFAAVGLRLAKYGEINGRYFCPAFFLAIGAGAEGFVWLVDVARKRLSGSRWLVVGHAAVAAAAVGLALDIVTWRDANRARAIELAETFAADLPRPITLAVSPTAGRLGNHLARAAHARDGRSFARVHTLLGHAPPPVEAARRGADAVLIETYHAPCGTARSFLEQFAAAGYVTHPWPDVPVADRFVLMLKPSPGDNPDPSLPIAGADGTATSLR